MFQIGEQVVPALLRDEPGHWWELLGVETEPGYVAYPFVASLQMVVESGRNFSVVGILVAQPGVFRGA